MTDTKPRTAWDVTAKLILHPEISASRTWDAYAATVLESWRRELLADVAAFVERQDDDCARCMARRIRDEFNLPHPPEPEVKCEQL